MYFSYSSALSLRCNETFQPPSHGRHSNHLSNLALCVRGSNLCTVGERLSLVLSSSFISRSNAALLSLTVQLDLSDVNKVIAPGGSQNNPPKRGILHLNPEEKAP